MGDTSRFLNIKGQNYRQIGFTGYIPDDNKVYGIRRNGDLQVADLVEVTSGASVDAYTKDEIDAKLAEVSKQSHEEYPWTFVFHTIATNVDLPAYTSPTYHSVSLDLSDYLPDAENYYEILLSIRAATSGSANLSIWGEYDAVTPELQTDFTSSVLPVQIVSSTGTNFCGGQFIWFTGPKRRLQLWTSYSSIATVKNLMFHGYRKITQPVILTS